MKNIYLIKKASFDPWENNSSEAFKYLPYGYVKTKKQAEKICSESRILSKKDCWAVHDFYGELKELIYEKIEPYECTPSQNKN